MIGKTIKTIEHSQWSDRALIRFTDGTALEIQSHGAFGEESDLGLNELTAEDIRRSALRLQGERERERLRRLQRTVPREPNEMSVFGKVLKDVYADGIRAMMADFNTVAFGTTWSADEINDPNFGEPT